MQNLGLLLHDAARLLRGEFERRARQHKMTLMQWRALKQLWEHDGITQTALGGIIEASPMTVSDILDRLEGMGLVRRETDPSDSRAKLVWVTPRAQPLIEEMRAIAAEVYGRALAGISPDDLDIFVTSLARIVENLESSRVKRKEHVS